MRSRALFLAAATLLGSPARGSSTPLLLARVNGEAITFDDLKQDFESRHQGHVGILGDEPVVREFLEASITKLLFVQEGRRMGLDARQDVRAKVAAATDRALSKWLYDLEIASRAKPSEAEIAEAADKVRDAREVVVVQTDTREEAEKARARLGSEGDAEAVARDLSTAESRLRGGVERFVWGGKEQALEAAVFGTPEGRVTEPVATEDGWVVAKVIRSVRLDPPPPAKAREMATAIVKRRRLDARRTEYLDSLRARYAAKVHEDLLSDEILTKLVAAGPGGTPDPRAVAEYRGGSIRLSDLAGALDRNAYLALRPTRRPLEASHVLSDRLDAALLRLEGARRLPEAPAEVRARVRAAEDDIVFQTLLVEVVFARMEISDSQVSDWYRAHAADYVEPPRIRVAAALLASETEASSFADSVRAGKDFAALARALSKDPVTASRGGEVGWVTEETAIPQIRDEAFRLPPGGLGGPARVEGGFLVYRVLERKESRQRTESEARGEIREKLASDEGTRRRKAWEEKLRKAARIEIDDAGVRASVARLKREEAERLQEKEERKNAVPPMVPGHGAHR